MIQSLKLRWGIAIASLVLGFLWIAPNFIKFKEGSWLAKNKMVLGLDIQGGLHLVMGVDVHTVLQERAARMVRSLDQELKDNAINHQGVAVVGEGKTDIEIKVAAQSDADAVKKFLDDRYSSTLQIVKMDAAVVNVRYYDAVMIEWKKQIIGQAIEVIRNRIDEFGVSEPSITAQGDDRILVQLPGIQDAARAKDLINRTAKLDFRVVNLDKKQDEIQALITEAETAGAFKFGGEGGLRYQDYIKKLNEALKEKLPANTRVVFEKLDNAANLEAGRRPYLVFTDTTLSGDLLDDASVQMDEMGRPEVGFRFNPEGRRAFADLTGKAVGGQIAIILDDVIKSAPSVERQIDSEGARITLGAVRDYKSAFDEASFIATALRAGALPAGLEQLEERAVGPSLGADSIKKGQIATLVGAILVFTFMLFYYRTAGVIASITLLLNIVLTYAILSAMKATLTLPGVAGIALTIGMAVDANVLIYERIKEELAKGASQAAAVRDGFSNALSAIMDSNITTILTCLVLMYYGTGPIRGFAVSLTIGLLVSMYTAVFLTRLFLDTLVTKLGLTVVNVKPAKA